MTFAFRKLALAAALATIGTAQASIADHQEFEATLHAPYRAAAGANEARSFKLEFSFPHAEHAQAVSWVLEVVDPKGNVVERWAGVEQLKDKPVSVNIDWAGRNRRNALPDGIYKARLRAMSEDAQRGIASGADAVLRRLAAAKGEVEEQEWEIAIGQQQAKADAPATMSIAAAPASLPYTVYFGNLHSQTNHSDGGGELASCVGAQNPQSGAYSPTDAFNFAKSRGLDFLMASEHNHMYDGSDSTNTSADPATAKALYQSGLSMAANFNAANPDFLAIYGMEWGVISNGGHMNIFNSNELLGWESNSSGQLIADTYTAKSDYASLYTLMKQRGWLGQFNHPSTSGQFIVNGVPLGYTADGDEAMALCEVMNTSAFSTNTSETETSRSNYEGACKKALEAGYHVAFSTDQDNHCANWGASYTNRTGVLIPSGTALSTTAFMDAIRARRVFATMDKTSQLVLTANGHMMGERFSNTGTLNLVANFSSSSGKTVSTSEFYEGVPGRNGTVTLLASSANTTITPTDGAHFYYAKVTQSDGNILWSAPVWVTQGAGGGGDTTAPTVSASSSGSSGTITFTANASDNVGVTKVEFYVDGVLKGTDTASPWTYAFNSSGVSNGTHSLTAKAYDAAGNSATSAAVNFSVNNVTAQQLVLNSGFESGATNWTATSGVITNDATESAHTGTWKAWLNGYGSAHTDTLYQQVSIPSTAATATLSFYLLIDSAETTSTQAYDTLKVQVRNSSGTVLATLATYSNLNKGTSYVQRTFDMSAYKGQTVRIYFEGVEGTSVATSFIVDDVTLNVQ
ncbi:carbohydrate-binding protein CenC [Pseudoduganella eburnea]|uniref:Carbohydrate-binding protein CenC n=1 Tax=Massilia eburnea TaxID=1776165 RepID=A0A6L6QP08_9BURK|nr:CehA/McbA family metallohydrolase [Massilia eburnea]MTW13396.1 carbohydrate-binding protein CenC [Massilia eburnea]